MRSIRSRAGHGPAEGQDPPRPHRQPQVRAAAASNPTSRRRLSSPGERGRLIRSPTPGPGGPRTSSRVLVVLEQRAQGGGGLLGLQPGRAQEGQGLGPVDRLGHPGRLATSISRSRGHRLGDLAGQGLGDLLGRARDDLDLAADARWSIQWYEAAALEGVVQLPVRLEVMMTPPGAGRRDPADLGDGDGELAQDLEQEGLELVVGPVDARRSAARQGREPGPGRGQQRGRSTEELSGPAPTVVGLARAQLGRRGAAMSPWRE